MKKEILCHCCGKVPATRKDYRYINSIECQGKILVCDKCFNLTDVDFVTEYCKGE